MLENFSALNITVDYAYGCTKCIVPEAVIPLSWRIIILINLIFTLLVYFTSVWRGKEFMKPREMWEKLKSEKAFEFMKLMLWIAVFVVVLVQPYVKPPENIAQIALLVILLALLAFNKPKLD